MTKFKVNLNEMQTLKGYKSFEEYISNNKAGEIVENI